ncbi:MAG: glycosyltransferase family 39 protein, partial [Candidatus Omnitrophota bacterium]
MKVFGVQTDRLTLAMAAFLGLACLSVSVVSFSGSINKIFTLDETDIAARAHMIVKEGPLGPMRFFGGGEAYPHPPLCEYAVALVFKCFGESERAARGLGAVCFVLVGLLTLLSARLLLKSAPPGLRLELLFAAGCLYLVNPLTIQHAMVVDADGFFTFLFVNLFVFVFLTFEDSKGRRYLLSRVLLAVIL